MKMWPYAFCLIPFLSLLQNTDAKYARCSPASRLTDDDARILLYVTPYAIDARKAGTDVDIEKSAATKEYPESEYFSAVLISQKPSLSALGNGIIGYFAVDKRSGAVISFADFTSVDGKELRRVQQWMRHAHCIQ